MPCSRKPLRPHALSAYDAVHLAGALSFAAGEELEFACWDKELRGAAKAGLRVDPTAALTSHLMGG
jgi:hypothetical protein